MNAEILRAHRGILITALAWTCAAGCGEHPGSSVPADAGADPVSTMGAGASDGATPWRCGDERNCDDGRFCNGLEVCNPDAPGARPDGCAPALERPCAALDGCSEALDRCLSECDLAPDADGDGEARIECGGEDCDDTDGDVGAGALERCNGVDDDCDGATDEALGDVTCGVGACERSVARCAGGVVEVCAPGMPSPEDCNGADDDCDGAVDEACGDRCADVRGDLCWVVPSPRVITIAATERGGAIVGGYGALARYHADGSQAWVRDVTTDGSPRSLFFSAAAEARDGSLLVAGRFPRGTTTFGAGEPGEATLSSSHSFNPFLARYRADGTLMWVRRFAEGASWGSKVSMGLLDDGGAVVAHPAAGSGFLLARFDASGSLVWSRVEGEGADRARGIAIARGPDPEAPLGIMIAGEFDGPFTLGSGEERETTLVSEYGFFLARYALDGTLDWAREVASPAWGIVWDVSSHPDGVLIAGNLTQGSTTFGPGQSAQTTFTVPASEARGFVALYEADGALAWVRSAGALGANVAAGADGQVLVTGYLRESATFGESEPAEVTLASAGENDIFVASYDRGGTLSWARRGGGPDHDMSFAVTVSRDGGILVGGRYQGTAVFGPGERGETTLVTETESGFFARLAP